MSLYLSCLPLNLRSWQVASELAHPYEMHRTLMRAFPKATDASQPKARGEFGVLFRPEADDRRGVVKVYVQSCEKPDWSFLNGLNDYCAEMEAPEHKDVMPAYGKIQKGQFLAFRLRANPTKRIAKDGDPMQGKRVELRRENEQLDWLVRKGQLAGFSLVQKEVRDVKGDVRLLPRVNVSIDGKQKGHKTEAGFGHVTTHLAVLFDGLLRVTDTTAFLETLVRGIGPGKAFGFGLLSVARARGDP